jgi:hypothetical protein
LRLIESINALKDLLTEHLHHASISCTRAILKVTSDELLIKQAMRKNYYIQKIHIYLRLKLLCNIVTARIEALVISGISFCMPVSRKLERDQGCKKGGQTTPS